jgi:hypothetical protein
LPTLYQEIFGLEVLLSLIFWFCWGFFSLKREKQPLENVRDLMEILVSKKEVYRKINMIIS